MKLITSEAACCGALRRCEALQWTFVWLFSPEHGVKTGGNFLNAENNFNAFIHIQIVFVLSVSVPSS